MISSCVSTVPKIDQLKASIERSGGNPAHYVDTTQKGRAILNISKSVFISSSDHHHHHLLLLHHQVWMQ